MLKRIAWSFMQRDAVRDASCFHATSVAESEEIRSHGFRQPIAVIPNGIDLPPNPPDPDARERVVLFLSRIHPKKGIDDLLLAWHRLHRRHESWTVKIAGSLDSDYARTLQRRAVDLALPRLSFLGELSGARKWDALGRAGLFVLPTRSENFGIAVAEALAAGTAVVVSKGAPWAGVVPQKCGWWHDIGPDGLEEALDQAMSLPLMDLHAYGNAGRAWMEREFNWDAIGARMRAVYEWQLGNGPRPTCVV
jgi:glycosyltransferase involved in cell wall biosynthesis